MTSLFYKILKKVLLRLVYVPFILPALHIPKGLLIKMVKGDQKLKTRVPN